MRHPGVAIIRRLSCIPICHIRVRDSGVSHGSRWTAGAAVIGSRMLNAPLVIGLGVGHRLPVIVRCFFADPDLVRRDVTAEALLADEG